MKEDTSEICRRKRIIVEKLDKTVSDLMGWIDDGTLTLKCDFQRNFVWNGYDKSDLIETILTGLILPEITLTDMGDGTYQILDGLQRLTTLRDFITKNEFSLKYNYKEKGVIDISKETRRETEGFYFRSDDSDPKKIKKGLNKEQQKDLKSFSIRVVILPSTVDRRTRRYIFKRINSGGTKLNTRELRNAAFSGLLMDLIKKLSTDDNFIKLSGEKENSKFVKRMGLYEYIERFLALITKEFGYEMVKGNYSDLIDSLCEKYADEPANSPYLKWCENSTKNTMSVCHAIFGESAFRVKVSTTREKKNAKKQPHMKPGVYNVIVPIIFEYIDKGYKELLLFKRDSVKSSYESLIKNRTWAFRTKYSHQSKGYLRYTTSKWRECLNKIIKNNKHILIEKDPKRCLEKEIGLELWDNLEDKKCPICKNIMVFEKTHKDHINPHSLGGKTEKNNTRLVCKFCNPNRTVYEKMKEKEQTTI